MPNYFLFLAINIVIAICYGRNLPSLLSYTVFLQNFAAPPARFFVESWSLAVEEWFYLLLPLLVLALPRRSSQRIHTGSILLLGILAVTVARGVYVALADPVWLTEVRMITVFRLDACLFGVAGAWWKYYHPQQWKKAARPLLPAGLIVLALMALAPFTLRGDSLFMRTGGFTLTSLGALFLLPALDRWRSGGGITGVAVTKVSLWSYSLYLVNYPVFILLQQHGRTSPMLLAIVFCVVSLLVSALLYRWYELPMMNLRDRWPLRKPIASGPLVAALAES